MTTKHTPGPWMSVDGAEICSSEGDKAHVEFCRVVGPWDGSTWFDATEATANARLICAAPMLLALLQRLNDGEEITKSELRDAIAKATGQ